jgi:hypothetical protein
VFAWGRIVAGLPIRVYAIFLFCLHKQLPLGIEDKSLTQLPVEIADQSAPSSKLASGLLAVTHAEAPIV